MIDIIDIEETFPGSGWLGIDYEKEQWYWHEYLRKGWDIDKNGEPHRLSYDIPFKITIEVDGKKLCIIKKDMNDIKVYDREEIFKYRVVDGYVNINNTLLEILEKFGYEDVKTKKFEKGHVKKGIDFWEYKG